ncbi:MAG: hypothetical protein HY046_03570 [Acidobacteria bacterium]|nr:hypothetical protein [Acidobacteriota bacterium]
MGRTVPTFRQILEETEQRWRSKFRRALKREDQDYFDGLFRRIRCYVHAATYQCSDNPMEAILLSIALNQEKRLHALELIVLGKEKTDAIGGVDSRPVPVFSGDDPVADGQESKPPSAD